jgi:acetyl-CoA carboxylase beta subunit
VTHRRTAREYVELVSDRDTFEPWDADVVSSDPLAFVDTMAYAERLRAMTERSGATEAIVTGVSRIDGLPVVLVVGEFGFLAGTLGVATAQRVVRAFDRAAELRLPVVALPISGGTRMQEGTPAFIQMAACAAAVRRFRDAGLPYISYLRNPTTGGVLASWASLSHVRLAGPRIVKEMTGQPFPDGVQVAEHLRDHGVIDDVVAPENLREYLRRLLDVLGRPHGDWAAAAAPETLGSEDMVDAWDAVQRSRQTDRPGITELLAACDAQPLRGDGAGEDDPACLAALTRVCGTSAVVVGQTRQAGQRGASLGAPGYRKARRAMRIAGELGLPLVTIIDTVGAAMTPHDEESGLATMIGECLADMAALPTPSVSILLGEGAGGGAIALLPADRVIAGAHTWLAPIAPEGASAILFRTADRAPEVAAAQAVASTALRAHGIVDLVVPDADDRSAQRMAAVLDQTLRELNAQDSTQRGATRRRRYGGG